MGPIQADDRSPADAPPTGGRSRLTYLDGLRGWAALVVLLFHTTWEMFGGYVPSIRVNALGVLTDGFLAVHVFFVLSGVALSQAFLHNGDRRALVKMALARYPRLVIPIAAASLIGLLSMRYGWLDNQKAAHLLGSDDWLGIFYEFQASLSGWLKFSLYDVFFDYDVQRSYDVILWTMPIELIGSFALFGILTLVGGIAVLRWLAYIVLAFVVWRHFPMYMAFVYGVVVAEVLTLDALTPFRDSKTASWIGSGLIVVACVSSPLLHHEFRMHEAATLAFMLVLGTTLSRPARNAFRHRVSRWLGTVSFPLYLVHSYVICSLGCGLALALDARGLHGAPLAAVTITAVVAASLAAAWLFLPVEVFAKWASHILASKAQSAALSGWSSLMVARPLRDAPPPSDMLASPIAPP